MKLSTLLLTAAGSLVAASDDRDLSGDAWAHITTPAMSKRQSTWNPPANLVSPLQQVWDHTIATYNPGNGGALAFRNYGYDIIQAAKGNLKFCVRWDSNARLTAAQRAGIEDSLSRNVRKWTDKLTGYEGWQYPVVTAEVTGYAARNRDLLEGDLTGRDFYTTADSEGVPECDPRCGRFFHQDNNYGSCPGGASRRYDMSLWLTAGMGGGAGGDWGQRVGSEYFLGALDNPHIWLHEFGHTLALDDFYDWKPTGVTNWIMLAGSSTVITDFDIWMMRDWWRKIASRYVNVPVQTTTRASTPTTTPVRPTTTSPARTTTRVPTTVRTTTRAATTPPSGGGSGAPLYGQCGGQGYTGPRTCAQGTCTFVNDWYSQCT